MFPDGLFENIIKDASRYITVRKFVIFLCALVLFSPEKGAIFSVKTLEIDFNNVAVAFQVFFGKIKLYQYVCFSVVVFLVSPWLSARAFGLLVMTVCNISKGEFLRRESVIVNKMEGEPLSHGEEIEFERSRRNAMNKIGRKGSLYSDVNSMLSIVAIFLFVSGRLGVLDAFFLVAAFFLVVWLVGLGMARSATRIYLDEVWPLVVIKKEREHSKAIANIKKT
ncbi:hypothetical protein [Salinicola sp. CR57]|uniref:hypothetical protein n=1 Tax=Salinicola sp. CR57 TaxID=1949086 RepID=UPI0013001B1F|nr:hypothetical protein [Salinicola sp. CR57]